MHVHVHVSNPGIGIASYGKHFACCSMTRTKRSGTFSKLELEASFPW